MQINGVITGIIEIIDSDISRPTSSGSGSERSVHWNDIGRWRRGRRGRGGRSGREGRYSERRMIGRHRVAVISRQIGQIRAAFVILRRRDQTAT